MPLSAKQLWALTAAAARELVWGLGAVSREIHNWQLRAARIPHGPMRDDALGTLATKHTHIAGAALFWILPARRDLGLLRLLVAFEITLEFLDNAHERAAGLVNGRQLHRALFEALDPWSPMSDYYLHHPWKDDGGYLRALVEACRKGCLSLPRYAEVRPLILLGAGRCGEVQSLNHEADPRRRVGLRQWADLQFQGALELSWWELTAAASSSLGVHALLAVAACGDGRDGVDAGAVHAAYVPWICALSTMLDSYVDSCADEASGAHSYLAYYPTPDAAARRMRELIERAGDEARRLRHGHRHAVIAACMVAMYLTNDSVRTPAMRSTTRDLAEAGGSLTRLLLPALRMWRIVYALRAT